MDFPHLFAPMSIGTREARNRVVLGAHFTMYGEPNPTFGEPGFYGERYGRYLEQSARGGVGIVIAGQAQVHPTTAYQMHNNAVAWDPAPAKPKAPDMDSLDADLTARLKDAGYMSLESMEEEDEERLARAADLTLDEARELKAKVRSLLVQARR